jgi:hypothetical protein
MKTPTFIFFILIISVLNACNSNSVHYSDYSDYSDFVTVKNIQFDEHNVSVILGMPWDMVVMNDMVIILDGITDRLFHVLSKDNYNHLGSFIRRGRGPDEEVEIFPFFKVHAKDEILYQTNNDLKVAKVIMSENSLDIIIHDKYYLPTSLRDGSDFYLVNNNIFNSNFLQPDSKDYLVLNTETGELSDWGGSIPLSDKKVYRERMTDINQKLSTVNLNENLIASVFNLLPIIRIYSLKNERLIIEQQMSDASNNLELLKTEQSNRLINYYHRIRSTDDYIYALYGGYSINDYFKAGESPFSFDWSREIHIWKWDGSPVMKLILDRPVISFDVTPDNKKIIATSVVDTDKLFDAVIPWN